MRLWRCVRNLVPVAVGLATSVVLIAQNREPGTLTFAVSGRVVERENGRAIGDVTVTLSPIHEAVDAAGNTVEVIPSDAQVRRLGLTSASKITTSDDGRFGFEHVAAGTYMLTAARNGYLPGLVQSDGALAPSQLLHVGSVERSTDVELRLVRPGVVSGTIVGQDNAPLVNVEVRALRKEWAAGRSRFVVAATTKSDDRGDYRLTSLVPGDYAVVARSGTATIPSTLRSLSSEDIGAELSESGGTLTSGERTEQIGVFDLDWLGPAGNHTTGLEPLGLVRVYPTSYYPDASTPTDGLALHVTPDSVTSADLQLHLVSGFTVSGSVRWPTDGSAPRALQIRLVRRDAETLASDIGFETAVGLSDRSGSFTLLGVPPGQYTLKVLVDANAWAPGPRSPDARSAMTATGPRTLTLASGETGQRVYWADFPVDVVDHDLDVAVLLLEGFRVTGEIQFDPPPDASSSVLQRVTLSLRAADRSQSGAVVNAAIDANGRFVSGPHQPGRFFVIIKLPDATWFVDSIMLGAQDCYCGAIDLETSDVNGLVVRLTTRRTTLSGTVTARSDSSLARARTAVLLPADVDAWISTGMNPRCVHTAPITNGAFVMTNLRPGRYLAALATSEGSLDLQDPNVVASIVKSTATPLTLQRGTNNAALNVR
jgi:Carboxypeptidase regulatory-like domain